MIPSVSVGKIYGIFSDCLTWSHIVTVIRWGRCSVGAPSECRDVNSRCCMNPNGESNRFRVPEIFPRYRYRKSWRLKNCMFTLETDSPRPTPTRLARPRTSDRFSAGMRAGVGARGRLRDQSGRAPACGHDGVRRAASGGRHGSTFARDGRISRANRAPRSEPFRVPYGDTGTRKCCTE